MIGRVEELEKDYIILRQRLKGLPLECNLQNIARFDFGFSHSVTRKLNLLTQLLSDRLQRQGVELALGRGITNQTDISIPMVGRLKEMGIQPSLYESLWVGLMRSPV